MPTAEKQTPPSTPAAQRARGADRRDQRTGLDVIMTTPRVAELRLTRRATRPDRLAPNTAGVEETSDDMVLETGRIQPKYWVEERSGRLEGDDFQERGALHRNRSFWFSTSHPSSTHVFVFEILRTRIFDFSGHFRPEHPGLRSLTSKGVGSSWSSFIKMVAGALAAVGAGSVVGSAAWRARAMPRCPRPAAAPPLASGRRGLRVVAARVQGTKLLPLGSRCPEFSVRFAPRDAHDERTRASPVSAEFCDIS